MSFLARLQTLAWGHQEWSYRDPDDDKKFASRWKKKGAQKENPHEGHPFEDLLTTLDRYNETKSVEKTENYDDEDYVGDNGDDEEAAEKAKAEPLNEAAKEGMKKIIEKSRRVYDRKEALRHFYDDQTYMREVATNEKQKAEVRIAAINHLNDQATLKRLADDTSNSVAFAALEHVKDKAFLAKKAEDGVYPALKKVGTEEQVLKYIEGEKELDEDSAYKLIDRVKSDAGLNKIADLAITSEEARKGDNGGSIYDNLFEALVLRTNNKDLLKKLAFQGKAKEQQRNYYGYNSGKPFGALAVLKLNDKAFAKELLEDSTVGSTLKKVSSYLVGDQEAFKKAVLVALKKKPKSDEDDDDDDDGEGKGDWLSSLNPDAIFYLEQIKDEKFKVGLLKESGILSILKYIKDKATLKEYANQALAPAEEGTDNGSDEIQRLLINSHPEVFTQEQLKKLSKNNKDAFKHITDQDFLKEKYLKANKSADYKADRIAAIDGITDQDFLLEVYKKDGTLDVREAVFKKMSDPKILYSMLTREKSKHLRHDIVYKLKEHQEYLLKFLDEQQGKDSDTDGFAFKKLSPANKKKFLTAAMAGNFTTPLKSVFNPSYVLDGLETDQAFLKKIAINTHLDKKLQGAAFEHINDEKFLVKYAPPEIAVRKVHDQKLLKEIAKGKKNDRNAPKSYIPLQAFKRITTLPEEDYEDLALNASTPQVREHALFFVKNEKVLEKVLLDDPDIGVKILPHFAKNKEMLEKAALKAKDQKVKEQLAGRITNKAILKKLAFDPHTDTARKAFKRLNDPKLIVEMLAKGMNKALVTEAFLLAIKDGKSDALRRFFVQRDFDLLEGIAYRSVDRAFDPLKDILTKSDFVEFFRTSPNDHSAQEEVFTKIEDANEPLAQEIARELVTDPAVKIGNYFLQKLPIDDHKLMLHIYENSPHVATGITRGVKYESVLHIAPEDLKPEMVTDLIRGLSQTTHATRVSEALKAKAYEIGTAIEQDQLFEQVPEEVLTDEHKEMLKNREYPYRTAKKGNRYRETEPKATDHPVNSNPQKELLRLLVTLAR